MQHRLLEPASGNLKLANHDYSYRLQVGDYRVFFEFDGGIRIISIKLGVNT